MYEWFISNSYLWRIIDYNGTIISLQVPVEVRKTIGRLRNCIKLLAHHSIMISPTSVMTAFDMSIEQEFEVSCQFFGVANFYNLCLENFYLDNFLWWELTPYISLQCSNIFQINFRCYICPYVLWPPFLSYSCWAALYTLAIFSVPVHASVSCIWNFSDT